ncbi:molybdopterin dinucleotide binding domain-containing protein, partial [Chloroflexota bacterium]
KRNPYHGEWPIAMPEIKGQYGIRDIQPIGGFKYIVGGSDREEIWEKLGAKYNVEMKVGGTNSLLAVGNRDSMAHALDEIPYIVVIELFNNETTEAYADIVLPDTCFLEKDNWATGLAQNFNHAWGMDDWCYHIGQKVVEPIAERRHSFDVGFEIMDRLGKEYGKDYATEAFARFYKTIPINDEYQPEPTERLSVAEIGDRVVKSMFGPEHDWDWFKEHGYIRWPKKVEEAYWMWFLDLRVPIYMEWLAHMKEAVEKIQDKTGVFMAPEQYTPLVSWFACTIHELKDSTHDLYCYSYRDVLHSASGTMEQPWLDEASLMNPYTYNITMNATTGKNKGLKDGDSVEVESYQGRKVKGTIKLMEGHHPQTVGIAATAGHWAKGQPIARGKGTNFDNLLPMDWEHMDPVCGTIETAVRVNVKKAG